MITYGEDKHGQQRSLLIKFLEIKCPRILNILSSPPLVVDSTHSVWRKKQPGGPSSKGRHQVGTVRGADSSKRLPLAFVITTNTNMRQKYNFAE